MSIQLSEPLVRDEPTLDNRRILALAQHDLGLMLRIESQDGEAQKCLEQANASQRSLAEESADVQQLVADLARSLQSYGLLLRSLGELDDAEDALQESISRAKPLVDQEDINFRLHKGEVHHDFGEYLYE